MRPLLSTVIVTLSLILTTQLARAASEVSEAAIGYQFGLTYLPLMVMQEQKLLEKEAAKQGLTLVPSWRIMSGPAPINDGLLSGDLQFGSVGVPSIVLLWSKTKSSLGIKMVGALAAMPMWLDTNRAEVKSLKDFGPDDRIAVASVKIGIQAVTFQMAAAQAFGIKQYDKLDAQTVGMGHPEAMITLLSGHSEVTAHFSSPPFQTDEIRRGNGKIHTILKSYDVLGGKATFTAVMASERFRKANPKTYAAFVAALAVADQFITTHPKEAAAVYGRFAKGGQPEAEIAALLADPDNVFDLVPREVGKYAAFMHEVGTVKDAATWRDLVHPNLLGLVGS